MFIPYSGVIIEIVPGGYVVKGYDKDNPVFQILSVRRKIVILD